MELSRKRPSLPMRIARSAIALAAACAFAVSAQPISRAERALFMSDHLGHVSVPTTLRYSMSKSGSMEKGFDDTVEVRVTGNPQTKLVTISCLSQHGSRLNVPPVESAIGNPAILCFLERDIREMKRLTDAKNPVYFQRRIRLALAETAEVKPIKVNYEGRELPAEQITIRPYLDDPNKARFEKYIGKYYVFVLSEHVPGTVFRIESVIPDRSKDGAPPLIREELTFARATAGDGQ